MFPLVRTRYDICIASRSVKNGGGGGGECHFCFHPVVLVLEKALPALRSRSRAIHVYFIFLEPSHGIGVQQIVRIF